MNNCQAKKKLNKLAQIEGRTVENLLADSLSNSVAKGICVNPGCNNTTDTEPDQSKGWCEECQDNTVKSCLVLAGVI